LNYDFGQSRKELTAIEGEIRNTPPGEYGQIEDRLVATLESPQATFACRQFVCRMLRQIGTGRSVPALSGFLSDEKMSDMARYAMQGMDSPEVDKAFRKALKELKGEMLVGVIGSIAQRRDLGAVDELARLVNDKDPQAAAAALSALGHIGNEKAAKALDGVKVSEKLKTRKEESLLMCADRMLADGNGAMALPYYREMLGEENPSAIRAAAYRGVALVEKEKAVPMVLDLLKGEDAILQKAAAGFVAEMPGKGATKAFAAELPALPPSVQVVLLSALAERGDDAALPAALQATWSVDEEVRVAAIRALANLGNASTVAVLAKAAASSGPEGAAAMDSLNRIHGDGVGEAVLKVAQTGEPDSRVKAIEASVARREKGALPILFVSAVDPDSNIRKAAEKGLGELAGQEDLAKLTALLKANEDSSERKALERAVVSTIGRIEALDAKVDPIVESLRDAKPEAKTNLLAVLSNVGGEKALQAVRWQLTSDNAEVKKAAIRALAEWPDPAPIADLLAVAKDDTDPARRIIALEGYVKLVSMPSDRWRRETVGLLGDAMKLAERAEEKKMILGALQEFPCREGLELAQAYLQDKDVAAEAEAAAKKLEGTSLIAAGSKVSASFNAGGASVINDQRDPGTNEDRSAPNFNFWSHKGTKEWVRYDFGKEETVSVVSVYWFDDSPSGGCRVPASWHVMYKTGKEWEPVANPQGLGVARDEYNRTTFDPVKTDALRLEIELQPNFSGGIYEWRVESAPNSVSKDSFTPIERVPSVSYVPGMENATPVPLIGDWEGVLTVGDKTTPLAAQVMDLGGGEFRVNVLAEFDKRVPSIAVINGKAQVQGEVDLSGKTDQGDMKDTEWKANLTGEGFIGNVEGAKSGTFELKRVARLSPTLGAAPPEGAVVLFDGKNMDEWIVAGTDPKESVTSRWNLLPTAAMQVAPGAGSIISKREFLDHKVHIEFRTPFEPEKRGQGRWNSGVYFEGRYEVQVLDSYGLEGMDNECGGVYSVAKPLVNMCAPPLQWQTYDVTFRAPRFNDAGEKVENARMTVLHNGVRILDNVEVPRPTTAAFMGSEKGPGGLYLQDHGNQVEYRNIWVVELGDVKTEAK
jgi:HEAT repeat protein